MPVRLGPFYALMLLFVCLATNIAFFAEVREPFLGDEDPTASIKSAFSEWDIQAKIAAFYPPAQSNAGEVSDDSPQAEEKHVSVAESFLSSEPIWQPTPPVPPQPSKPAVVDPVVDPFLPIAHPPKESELPESVVPFVAPEKSEPVLPTAAVASVPSLVIADTQPVVAEQFKPVIVRPESVTPTRPASTPVWNTVDTMLERPIRYD